MSTSIATGRSTLGKNIIINGEFLINQREVNGTVTLAAGAYGHDRWKAGASGCTYTFSKTNGLVTLTITAGSLKQIIEGDNLPHGTSTCTLSWSGTAQGKIGAGSYSSSGVTASVTGGTDLTVEFGVGTLALVQFEKGNVVTEFEKRSLALELTICQRYFEVCTVNIYAIAAGVQYPYCDSVHFKVTKRIAPTVTTGSLVQYSNLYAYDMNVFPKTTTGFIFAMLSNTAGYCYLASQPVYVNAEL